MRNSLIQAAVMTALGLASAQAMATGLVALPTTGFTVSGGTSAYTLCSNDGNFGSTVAGPTTPTTSANNTCAVFPANTSTPPKTTAPNGSTYGTTRVASSTSNLNLNDAAHTNGTNVKVGTIKDDVWRSADNNFCIYAIRVSLINADYDLNTAGTQTFEVNDIARAGFAALDGSNSINAGYFVTAATGDDVGYRIGRTFTSVQHRADPTDSTGATAGAGYLAQPLTASAPTPPGIPGGTINGLTTYPTGTPTAAQQAAALSTNWVDFTTDVNYDDADGSSRAASAMYYVEAHCTSATPAKLTGALRFRQSGQETGQLIEISADGYAPAGGTTAY